MNCGLECYSKLKKSKKMVSPQSQRSFWGSTGKRAAHSWTCERPSDFYRQLTQTLLMSFRKPTEVEWKYTEEGERVRVSLRTGRIIPKPVVERRDGIVPQQWKGGRIFCSVIFKPSDLTRRPLFNYTVLRCPGSVCLYSVSSHCHYKLWGYV